MAGLKTALLTLWAPSRALPDAAEQRRFAWPLLLATLIAALWTALFVQRADLIALGEEAVEQMPQEDRAKLTPHEREEKIETTKKIAVVSAGAKALLAPAFLALAGAFMLWLGLKVAGGRPGFVASFCVLAHAMLPVSVARLLSIPALLSRPSLPVDEAEWLLPSSLAAVVPQAQALSAPRLALLGSVDLFALWSVALAVLGMAHVAKVSRLRAGIVVLVLWASFVLVFRFALPSLTPPGPAPS